MMAIKRALVVDDSRSARVSLKLLLEEHDLQVDLAESGEDALEFLKKEDVDVIFMDHTMPGMDGLEAVAAIKANPRTATIPVMMYTTREGEVYVGQARALGAVGVMPKNVQKHQLFEMLRKLGLVQDRREGARAEPTIAEAMDEVDKHLDEQAMGISLQAVVRRILEDQHLTLRSDILRQQKVFAKEVAREVLKEHLSMQARELPEPEAEVPEPAPRRPHLATAALVVVATVAGFFALQFKSQRDAALEQLVAAEVNRAEVLASETATLQARLKEAQAAERELNSQALATLAWSVNNDNGAWMDADAFSPMLAAKLRDMLPRLEEMGFQGEIRLVSHLGRFCLETDANGAYVTAADETPVLACTYTGHVLEDSDYVSDRLSVEFAELLREVEAAPFRVTLEARDGSASEMRVGYPGTDVSAGEWNAVARQNNRVEIALVPDLAVAQN